MEYGEFWILETAVWGGVPFCCIVGRQSEIEARWNKPYHHLSRAEALDLLDRLARDGDIVASDDSDTEFTPSRQQVDSWLVYAHPRDAKHWYRLTPQGGARWERFARADWDRFHSFEWDWEEDDVLEVGATTPEMAERVYRYVVPWNGLRVFPETVERRVARPWTPLYWKTLPVGYCGRLKCRYSEEDDEMSGHPILGMSAEEMRQTPLFREYEYFQDWYARHPDTPRTRPV